MTASLLMAAENDWLRSMVEATFSPSAGVQASQHAILAQPAHLWLAKLFWTHHFVVVSVSPSEMSIWSNEYWSSPVSMCMGGGHVGRFIGAPENTCQWLIADHRGTQSSIQKPETRGLLVGATYPCPSCPRYRRHFPPRIPSRPRAAYQTPRRKSPAGSPSDQITCCVQKDNSERTISPQLYTTAGG